MSGAFPSCRGCSGTGGGVVVAHGGCAACKLALGARVGYRLRAWREQQAGATEEARCKELWTAVCRDLLIACMSLLGHFSNSSRARARAQVAARSLRVVRRPSCAAPLHFRLAPGTQTCNPARLAHSWLSGAASHMLKPACGRSREQLADKDLDGVPPQPGPPAMRRHPARSVIGELRAWLVRRAQGG